MELITVVLNEMNNKCEGNMIKEFKGIEVLRLGVAMPSGRVYADNEVNRAALAEYQKRIDQGTAYVEFGMPNLDGIDVNNQQVRMASISHRRTCARVTGMRIDQGQVLGDFNIEGAMAPELLKMLEETGEPPAFAIRSFAKPAQVGSEVTLHHVVSFDFIGTLAPEAKSIEEVIPETVRQIDAQMRNAVELPDGSGAFTGSFPLPKDHWMFDSTGEGSGQPPMPFRMGVVSPFRPVFEKAIRQAAEYAVRASTACGTDKDFDPDAMVNNMIIGLLGYFTEDGLAGDALDALTDHPRFFAGRLTLPQAQVKDIAMANGFTEKPQGDGKPDDLHPYVYTFADALSFATVQQFIGELGTSQYLADVKPPQVAAKLDLKND